MNCTSPLPVRWRDVVASQMGRQHVQTKKFKPGRAARHGHAVSPAGIFAYMTGWFRSLEWSLPIDSAERAASPSGFLACYSHILPALPGGGGRCKIVSPRRRMAGQSFRDFCIPQHCRQPRPANTILTRRHRAEGVMRSKKTHLDEKEKDDEEG